MHGLLLSPHQPELLGLVKTLASYIKSTDYGLDVTPPEDPDPSPAAASIPPPSAVTPSVTPRGIASTGGAGEGEGPYKGAADMDVDHTPAGAGPGVAWRKVGGFPDDSRIQGLRRCADPCCVFCVLLMSARATGVRRGTGRRWRGRWSGRWG
jgi:hypothetical protein